MRWLALLLVAPVAAQGWADRPLASERAAPLPASAAVLDAAGVVDVTPDGLAASRVVAVTCPAGSTCRLVAEVVPVAGPVATVALAAHVVAEPGGASGRAYACAAATCTLASGLAGRSLVALDLSAHADALAPAGAHPFHLRLWVVPDPTGDLVAAPGDPAAFPGDAVAFPGGDPASRSLFPSTYR